MQKHWNGGGGVTTLLPYLIPYITWAFGDTWPAHHNFVVYALMINQFGTLQKVGEVVNVT